MKAAINQVKEINRLKEAIAKTQSKYLIIDYEKRIHNLKKELREYCTYRNINYHKLMSEQKGVNEMDNIENLEPVSTREEAAKKGRKGGSYGKGAV